MATSETSDTTGSTEVATLPPAQAAGGPSFLALIAGGFLAAALGYCAAFYGNFGLFAANDGADEEMAQILASQESRLDQIETALGAPDDASARLDASDAGLEELRGNLGSLFANVDSLDERIGGVEAGIAGISDVDPGDAGVDLTMIEDMASANTSIQGELQARIDSLAQDIAAIQGETTDEDLAELDTRVTELAALVDQQSSAIEDASSAATDETRRIAAQATLSDMRAALENGTPYADTVGAFSETSDVEMPAALSAPAGDGVATLTELRNSFSDAARAGLDASLQVVAGESTLNRFGAFIKSQTGARALGEQPGDGPDAILSRAEARLNEGDVVASLSELDALPDEGRAAMSGWIDRARTRVDAQAALAELSQSMTSN